MGRRHGVPGPKVFSGVLIKERDGCLRIRGDGTMHRAQVGARFEMCTMLALEVEEGVRGHGD